MMELVAMTNSMSLVGMWLGIGFLQVIRNVAKLVAMTECLRGVWGPPSDTKRFAHVRSWSMYGI